jgi:hypothetical protein
MKLGFIGRGQRVRLLYTLDEPVACKKAAA